MNETLGPVILQPVFGVFVVPSFRLDMFILDIIAVHLFSLFSSSWKN
jgi:hypothetical protein